MDSISAAVDVFALRILERCISIIIGGLAIYLGYRLFLEVPDRNVSSGEVSVLNARVVLSRVGPGVFFALFGAGALALSLYRPMLFEHDAELVRVSGAGSYQNLNDPDALRGGIEQSRPSKAALRDERTLIKSDIAILNTLTKQLDPKLSEADRNSDQSGIARIKFKLMEQVWIDDDWGDRREFKKWVLDGAPDPVPAGLQHAAKFFHDPYGA